MERKETNRAKQLSIDKEFQKGVSIIDVDSAIAYYMSNVIIPDLKENDTIVKVPIIYGNAERWKNARKDGYLRDQRGRIQIPLVMFKRTGIEKNDNLPHFKEGMTIPVFKKYSSKNRYDRFSILNNTKPTYELYNITIPSYVNVTYEMVIWTSFTEHMNTIIEMFQNESEKYWGNADGFKFLSQIGSFDTTQEVGEGSERVIRTTFTTTVNAYLIPSEVDNKPTIKKTFSAKKVVFGYETDLTGGLFTNVTAYNEYYYLIDFVATRSSKQAEFINSTTVKLTNVKKPILPPELQGSFDELNWFKVYINGVLQTPLDYTYYYDGGTNEITFTFNNLGFPLSNQDDVLVTGKFKEL